VNESAGGAAPDAAPSPGTAGTNRGAAPARGAPRARRKRGIDKSVIWILALALALTAFAYYKSPALAWKGGEAALRLFIDILPALLAGFLLGGMVQVLVPKEWVALWAGEQSGFRGLTLATVAGALTPGGPFVQFPLVASLWQAGAGVGPITAYLISWTLLGINKLFVWEVPMMGWRYTIAKTLACLAAPMLLGWFASWIYRHIAGWG
jgi:uncharacterized membrane protein YraQ (UPF0718 family)